ncbi:glycosyltransferase family 2 protein [Buttiauxella agrestis]|uniref:dTDP-rhamnosyl transferase n=1 Tax=Buttiauxella agrestis ATCC 33320 TaxID=1006004 RepID=A0A085GB60_9ENTR|nr:glycosyltransferase family 2 protein [Buttiauxella agrestis]KFC80955.1 dTDP-rhamnosyl transferase [Buttiauxella agrestis ATCC 33320]
MRDYELKIVGIVVLYNPDAQALYALLNGAIKQLTNIILIDNSETEGTVDLTEVIKGYSHMITYIHADGNVGIAAAQNIGIQSARKIQATHVLLLDQDSLLPKEMVSKLLDTELILLNDGVKIAAIGPAFFDVKTKKTSGAIIMKPFYKKMIPVSNKDIIATDYLIASGSLIRTEVFDKVGMMDESLFIDLVDIEWCERCNRKGYYSYIAPNLIMNHNIGSKAVRVMGKNLIIHNDFRHYFVVRNIIFLLFKNSLSFRHKVFLTLRLPLFIVTHSLFAKNKILKIKLFITAIKDGFNNKMGRGHFY